MKVDQELYEKLQKLYRGELASRETTELKSRMNRDIQLQELYTSVVVVEQAAFHMRMSDIRKLSTQVRQKQKSNNWIKYFSLSLIVTMIGVGTYIYVTNKRNNEYVLSKHETTNKPKIEPQTSVPDLDSVPSEEKIKDSLEENFNKLEIQAEKVDEVGAVIQTDDVFLNDSSKQEVPLVTQDSTIAELETKPFPAENKTIVVNPCDTSSVQINLTIFPACYQTNNGQVLAEVDGGVAPYSEEIMDQEDRVYLNDELAPGQYEFTVEDSQGCKRSKKFIINFEPCQKHRVFNPLVQEYISFEGYEGVLSVRGQSGELYYQKELYEYSEFQWDGLSENGILKEGLFVYTIEADGKQIEFGTITIVK